MVDGTGLENQHTKVSQVRILSLPPCLLRHAKIKDWNLASLDANLVPSAMSFQEKIAPEGLIF